MSHPVKLSETLVLDARLAGEAQQRSIAGQVEFWARLGRALELLLDGRQVLTISRTSGAKSLAELLEVVDTAKGREIFKGFLEGEPFPHYESYAEDPRLLVRWEKDGEKLVRTVGRFVNREFVPMEEAKGGEPDGAAGRGGAKATRVGKTAHRSKPIAKAPSKGTRYL